MPIQEIEPGLYVKNLDPYTRLIIQQLMEMQASLDQMLREIREKIDELERRVEELEERIG